MDWHLLEIIIIGAICGYVASRLLGGDGFGLIGNIFVGVLGGWIGSELIRKFAVTIPSGFLGRVISTIGGAIVLIIILEILKKITGKSRSRR